jgi:RNA polymerase sigma factor (sigma-70 family)
LAGASLLRLQSDSRLAELAVAGHVAAFDAIVDRYRTPLLRYCAGIVGPSRAEDAVQQALINAHDALQRTDEVRHLRSWLYRIAHNAALNVLRAVRDDVPLDDASLPSGAGPAEAFESSERFRATVEALRELPDRQRAALVLRELEGRSHEEIAEALGVTKGSARQHLMRARVAMRGAVTAITPYPVLVRLADALASPGGSGWTDAAVGAGTGATLAKLTAGVAATGALVGGAVGTREVVHHHRGTPSASAAETRKAAPAVRAAAAAPVVRHATPVVLPARAAPAAGGSGGTTPASDDHDRATTRHQTPSRHRHHQHRDRTAPTVVPAPLASPSAPLVTSGDDHSPASGRGPSRTDDSTTSRHGSSNRGSSDGKDSSGHGSSDSKGSSGKGKSNTKSDDPPTTTIPPVTTPTTTPSSGSGASGSGSGDPGSGSGASGSDTSGSSSSGSSSSGSSSSGSGSSGSNDSGSGSGSSGDDGTTTVPDDD